MRVEEVGMHFFRRQGGELFSSAFNIRDITMRRICERSLSVSDRAARHLVRAIVLVNILGIGAAAQVPRQQSGTRPSFEAVVKSVAQYFKSVGDYQPGDLVSQSRVAAALAHVEKTTGWKVPERKAIVDRALADSSFLVTQLPTPSGRAFMRQVAKSPGGYSRLDRLSTISGGQQFIKDLMSKKGGSDMIEYLATTRGGHELGAMMAGVQHGVDLNKPTGRIYTADDLLSELRRLYSKNSS